MHQDREELESRLEATHTADLAITCLIVLLLGLLLGYFIGLRQSAIAGAHYIAGGWDWRFGVPAALIPVFFSRALYRWLRGRRIARYLRN